METDETLIRVRDCACPGTPHPDGDYVQLAEELSFVGGMAAQGAINGALGDDVALQESLAGVWTKHGVVGWNLVDGRGKPRMITPEGVQREFPYSRGGRLIAEACDDRFGDEIMGPLRERLRLLSGLGSEETSGEETSPPNRSTRRQRKRSSTGSTGRARHSA